MMKILLLSLVSFASLTNTSNALTIERRSAETHCTTAGKGCWAIHSSASIKGALEADASYTTRGGLTMTFSAAKMTSDQKKEFSQAYYVEDNDIVLDAEICQGLKAPRDLTIKKGKYKIVRMASGYRVDFVTTTIKNK